MRKFENGSTVRHVNDNPRDSWFWGKVEEYDVENRMYKVRYDDGEWDWEGEDWLVQVENS